MTFSGPLKHIMMQEDMSQIVDFATSFNFMTKNREDLGNSFAKDFLQSKKFRLWYE